MTESALYWLKTSPVSASITMEEEMGPDQCRVGKVRLWTLMGPLPSTRRKAANAKKPTDQDLNRTTETPDARIHPDDLIENTLISH